MLHALCDKHFSVLIGWPAGVSGPCWLLHSLRACHHWPHRSHTHSSSEHRDCEHSAVLICTRSQPSECSQCTPIVIWDIMHGASYLAPQMQFVWSSQIKIFLCVIFVRSVEWFLSAPANPSALSTSLVRAPLLWMEWLSSPRWLRGSPNTPAEP